MLGNSKEDHGKEDDDCEESGPGKKGPGKKGSSEKEIAFQLSGWEVRMISQPSFVFGLLQA